MIRSCIVLDQPSYDAFDTTDDFMTLWNKIVRETEEIKTSMECNQCKLRHVCNTCAAAAIAECGDLRAFQNIYVNIRRKQLGI